MQLAVNRATGGVLDEPPPMNPVYSSLFGEPVPALLTRLGVTELDVVGLATDYCVRASALDARAAGLEVRVLSDLVAGVSAEASAAALRELEEAGVRVEVSSTGGSPSTGATGS